MPATKTKPEPEIATRTSVFSFSAEKKKLAEAIDICARSLSKKSSHPVLETFKFELNPDSLELSISAFDLGISVLAKIEVERVLADSANEINSVCVPGVFLKELIAKLAGEIAFDFYADGDARSLEVSSEQGKYIIPCLSAEMFPELPVSENDFSELDGHYLTDLLSVVFSASTDPIKLNLCGVHLKFDSDSRKAISYGVDGNRVASAEVSIPHPFHSFAATVPAEAARLLKAVCADEKIQIACSDAVLFARTEAIEVSVRLLEGEYPRVDQLIPRQFAVESVVPADTLAGACSRLGLLYGSNAPKKFIQFLFEDCLRLEVLKGDRGVGGEQLPLQSAASSPLSLGLPSNHVVDALSFLGADSVRFCMNNAQSPVILVSEVSQDCDLLCLIMPRMLKDENNA